MELAPGDDAFLTYKGIDTRKGACAYYYQIGAVEGCDGDGFPTGAQLTLDQWRNNHNLSPFHNGNPAEPEFKAIYINKQDLNLTRDMQAIKLQDGTLAYNVCNYPGPQDATDPLASPKLIGEETQPDIDLAIDNAKRGIGKVVCVAMDYTPTEGVRFYTFSPSGRLLLSVSLDGRREKFMPGACVACHGGDNYGGKFPDNYTSLKKGDLGPGQANLGSYFLPFDVANFYFSSTDPSLKPAVLFAPLRQMNQLLTQVPTPQIKPIADDLLTLINGWYPANNNDDKQSRPAPPIYSDQSNNQPQGTRQCGDCHGSTVVENYDARRLHKAVIASNCQICHTSNASVHDPRAGGEPRITFIQRPPAHYLTTTSRGLSIIAPPPAPQVICGGSADLKKNHTMPNALGSFERFWRQPVKAKDLDLPAWLFAFPPLSDSILDVNLRDLDLNQEPTPVSQPGLQEGGCANLSARPAL
jgi:mono/diheme cytochrome c family protein